jgi:putative transposase
MNVCRVSDDRNMANTFSQIYFHIVFSTKDRVDFITRDIEQRVWASIGGIAKNHRMKALQVGGIDNHAHALISSSTTHSPADIAQLIKGNSSSWIHTEFPHLQKFAWQDGYGVFSVSRSVVPEVIEYIKNQREHRKKQSFEEEFVSLLKLHEIDYDERYLFG